MTFLEICNAVLRESDIPGDEMATTAGQIGEKRNVVRWVQNAWDEIYVERLWNFRKVKFSQALTASATTFDLFGASALNVSAEFTSDPYTLTHPTTGQKRRIELMTQTLFEDLYSDRLNNVEGWPLAMMHRPDGLLEFDRPLDVAYVLEGWYMKQSDSFSVDSDTPDMPDVYHQAVVYRALKKYAEFEEAGPALQYAMMNDATWSSRMARDLLPKMVIGGSPLA